MKNAIATPECEAFNRIFGDPDLPLYYAYHHHMTHPYFTLEIRMDENIVKSVPPRAYGVRLF